MRTIWFDFSLKSYQKKILTFKLSCVATIGVFDGVHLGHQVILKKVKTEAEKRKTHSLVITFDIPPQIILKKPFLGCISNFEQKKQLIASLGIDYLLVLKTSRALLKLEASEFLDYLFRNFNITELIVGEDFSFGYKKGTNVFQLKELSKFYNFKVKIIKKKKISKQTISSTFIRKCIRRSDFVTAKKYLGRAYSIVGRLQHGRGLGRILGFPTVNLNYDRYVLPSKGVYAGYVLINDKYYLAAINVGTKPTVSSQKKIELEVHIIDFDKSKVSKNLEVFFISKIRNEKKFVSLEKLQSAIKNDILYIKNHFKIPHN